MSFTTELVYKKNRWDKHQLVQPLGYEYEDRTWIVPKGFRTDGASIPRILWTPIGSPFTGNYTKPAVLHDYLYYTGDCLNRADADGIFLQAMKDEGVSFLSRWTIWSGVRIGGGATWAKYRAEERRKS